MRLFIALDVAILRDELARLQNLLPNQFLELRLADSYHLTLHFLGEVDESTAINLKEQLSVIASPPFSFTLNHIGFFPPTGNPRVVWVGIEPEALVKKLREEIGNALLHVGIKPERRFSPHITLARVTQVRQREAATQALKDIRISSVIGNAEKFSLIKSTLTPKGSVYETLMAVPLRR